MSDLSSIHDSYRLRTIHRPLLPHQCRLLAWSRRQGHQGRAEGDAEEPQSSPPC
jgi:hypothetical protein